MEFRSSGRAIQLSQVMEDIARHWEYVVAPNGDPQKWDGALLEEFRGHSIFNWTDFNYGKSNTYEILVQSGAYSKPGSLAEEGALIQTLGGERLSVLLKLSAVAPYYLVRLLRRKLDECKNVVESSVESATPQQRTLVDRARRWAERRGFVELPEDYLRQVIPDAELELAEQGTVTVYNCLFEDQSNSC